MKLLLHLDYTDGREFSADLSDIEKNGGLSLGDARFSLKRRNTSGMEEYTVSFVPTAAVQLSCVRIDVPLEETSIGKSGEVLIFDNSYSTNLFAGIRRYTKNEDFTRSRTVICAKSENGAFNCAFTTFERFLTDFYVWKNLISIHIYLEDKPVTPGEEYVLESFTLDEGDGLAFFERFTELMRDRYVTRPRRRVPFGWSSWSCMYGDVNEGNLIPEMKKVGEILGGRGGLIQIDDGWQGSDTFLGTWDYDPERFPSGGAYPAKVANDAGMKYGLWIAPAVISEDSPNYERFDALVNRENGEKKPSFANIHPLDLSSETVLDMYRGIFRKLTDECGSEYFKVDFHNNLYTRLAEHTIVHYKGGYVIEVYRNFLRTIREAVGDGVFLNGCGASFGESAGIFDGIRSTSDITWNGVGSMDHLTWWDIFRENIWTMTLRAPFDKVFILDPDGLVVRDYLTPHAKDEVSLTLEEARCYATAVAMSGGHVLLNEETLRLSEERLKLYTHIIPSAEKSSARPADFFETPFCSESFVPLENGKAAMVALYNLGEEPVTKSLDTQRYVSGKAALIDAWTHDVIAVSDGKVGFDLPRHTSRAILVKAIPERDGEVLFSASNFWCGYGASPENEERAVVFSQSGADGMKPYPNTAGLPLYTRNN